MVIIQLKLLIFKIGVISAASWGGNSFKLKIVIGKKREKQTSLGLKRTPKYGVFLPLVVLLFVISERILSPEIHKKAQIQTFPKR